MLSVIDSQVKSTENSKSTRANRFRADVTLAHLEQFS